MKNGEKTKDQLVAEIRDLRRRLAEAERSHPNSFNTDPTHELDADEHLITRESITHNGPADDSVLESAAMLENILNKAADGICVFHNVEDSSKVRFTHWNPRMVQITGYTIDEINQLGWFQKMFPDPVTQQNALERMYRMQEGDQVVAEEWVITSREGKDVPVSVSSSVLKEENGRIHILAFLQDIRERKHADEELRSSEARFRTLIETMNEAFGIQDENGFITYINERLCEMLGYTSDELIGKGFAELLDEQSRETLSDQLDKRKEGQAGNYEVKFVRKNGERVAAIVSGTPVFDREGNFKGAFGVATDITDRRRMEEALRESEERFRLTFHESPIGAIIASSDFSLQHVNAKLCSILGYSEQELLKTKVGNHLHPDDAAEDLEEAKKVMSGELDESYRESRCIRKDGQIIWISRLVRVVRNTEGRPLYFLSLVQDITERKLAEEALAKQAQIVNQVHDAIISTDWEGRITSWNRGAERLHGYTEEEVLGKPVFSMLAEEYRELLRNVVTNQLPEKDEHSLEVLMLKKSGDTVWVHVSLTLVRNQEGKLLGVIGYGLDISDRKEAEKALRVSEARLRKIYEEAPIMMHSIDKKGVVRNVNTKWLYEMGYRREDVIGKEIEEFMTPASRRALHDVLPRFWTERKVTALPYQYVKKDGTVIDVLLDSVVTEDPSMGEVSLSAVRDITQQKRAEEALRMSESTLRTLIQAAPIGIGHVTKDLTLDWTNEVFCTMTGYSTKELVGQNARILYGSEEEYKRVGRIGLAEVRSRGSGSIETRFRRKDGTEFDVLLSASSTVLGDLSQGQVFTVVDITQRKRLEEQLLRSQKMEAVGTLAGGVAHDFNNLLHVIQGYSEMALQDLKPDDPGRFQFEQVRNAARSAAELTQSLLTFSRRVESTLRPSNLNHELKQVSRLLARTIPKMIKIDLRLSKDLMPVRADPAQIQQIVMNLAVNSRDAMPDGGELSIETQNVYLDEEYCRDHAEVEPGNYVVLSVSDNGFGMDRKTLERVFEPFFTTKKVGKGTGLGLSIVYGIVKSHGGSIHCYSEPGQGTSFKIYLPAIGQEATPDEIVKDEVPIGGTETLLIVDDDESVRNLGEEILTRYGYTVLSASNGKEGVEIFDNNKDRISLVIMDLIMPEMGGRDCLNEILKIDPMAKILIASGYAANGQIDAAIGDGAKGSIRKPYEARQLLKTVRRVLEEIS